MSARPCGTCNKSVYPKEKIAISDVWLHRECLKCYICSSTLGLNSVYVSIASGEKKLYCKVDVPRAVHTAVVDSIALRRAITAPKASSTSASSAQLPGNGSRGSMRFKGLTLRSKGMRGGLEAQSRTGGVMNGLGRVIVGNARGSTLDSWDIQHALEVQSHVSSPHTSHPALTAQLTGGGGGQQFMSPSILTPQVTGRSDRATWIQKDETGKNGGEEGEKEDEEVDDGIAREKKGVKEVPTVEKDLVKNLLRAFQLDTLSIVELPPLGPLTPSLECDTNRDLSVEGQRLSSSNLPTPTPSTFANTQANASTTHPHPYIRSTLSKRPTVLDGLMAPPPTPIAKRTTPHDDNDDDQHQPQAFASIKLPGGTLGTLGHDARFTNPLTLIGTLGSRRGFKATTTTTTGSAAGSAHKPRLQSLFDPPSHATTTTTTIGVEVQTPPTSTSSSPTPNTNASLPLTNRVKSVRIASGKPSIIEMFADPTTTTTTTQMDDGDDDEEGCEEIGDEEFARRMEEQGLEVTLVYEEEVEPVVVQV